MAFVIFLISLVDLLVHDLKLLDLLSWCIDRLCIIYVINVSFEYDIGPVWIVLFVFIS